MKLQNHTDAWFKETPNIFDLLRVFLGAILLTKGIELIRYNTAALDLIKEMPLTQYFPSYSLLCIMIIIQIVGGILICIGYFTRVSCLAQIPILAAAMYAAMIHSNMIIIPYSQWFIPCLLLLLAIFYFIEGAGSWSVYGMRKNVSEA